MYANPAYGDGGEGHLGHRHGGAPEGGDDRLLLPLSVGLHGEEDGEGGGEEADGEPEQPGEQRQAGVHRVVHSVDCRPLSELADCLSQKLGMLGGLGTGHGQLHAVETAPGLMPRKGAKYVRAKMLCKITLFSNTMYTKGTVP